jgi:hypothetical protein
MSKYIYDKLDFSEEYREELIEFIKHNANAEIGGYRIYDGIGTHLMQNPYELSDFIIALKKHEENIGSKLSRFLEVGFSSGINNTLLNKFFKFDEIVGVDFMGSQVNGFTLKGHLMHKNLTLVCGDSTSQRVLDIVGKLGKYDLIFIDANHTYEYVKKDFNNYKEFLNDNGVIAFHDIDCPDWPGINKFWNEMKETGLYNQQEFVCRDYPIQYGIGMVTVK